MRTIASNWGTLLPFLDLFAALCGNGMLESMLEPHLKYAGAGTVQVGVSFLVFGCCYMLGNVLFGGVCATYLSVSLHLMTKNQNRKNIFLMMFLIQKEKRQFSFFSFRFEMRTKTFWNENWVWSLTDVTKQTFVLKVPMNYQCKLDYLI